MNIENLVDDISDVADKFKECVTNQIAVSNLDTIVQKYGFDTYNMFTLLNVKLVSIAGGVECSSDEAEDVCEFLISVIGAVKELNKRMFITKEGSMLITMLYMLISDLKPLDPVIQAEVDMYMAAHSYSGGLKSGDDTVNMKSDTSQSENKFLAEAISNIISTGGFEYISKQENKVKDTEKQDKPVLNGKSFDGNENVRFEGERLNKFIEYYGLSKLCSFKDFSGNYTYYANCKGVIVCIVPYGVSNVITDKVNDIIK